MSSKGHGQIRRSQVITTFGPGALIDLPYHSAIIGGLDTWTGIGRMDQIIEPRMSRILQAMTGVGNPGLYPPPPEPESWQDKQRGIGAWRFPEWFIVQEVDFSSSRWITRRMVHRTALDDQGRFEKNPWSPRALYAPAPRAMLTTSTGMTSFMTVQTHAGAICPWRKGARAEISPIRSSAALAENHAECTRQPTSAKVLSAHAWGRGPGLDATLMKPAAT